MSNFLEQELLPSDVSASFIKAKEAESISALKKATVENATAHKAHKLDPIFASNKDRLEANSARLATALQDVQIKAAERQYASNKWVENAHTLIEKHDPNSAANKGKVVTVADLEDSGVLSWNNLKNIGANLKKGAGDVVGMAVGGAANALYFNEMGVVDPEAVSVHEKLKKNTLLKKNLDTLMTEARENLLRGVEPDTATQSNILKLQAQIAETDLTDADNTLLNKSPENAHSGYTNLELIQRAEKIDSFGQRVPGIIDEFIGGSKHAQSWQKDREMLPDIEARNAENVRAANEAVALSKQGKYLEALTKGAPAVGSAMIEGVAAGASNTLGATQAIAEEAPDILLARLGPGGIIASALESIGMSGQMKAEFLRNYIKEHGKMPSREELASSSNWSNVAGYLDMGSDVLVSGAGKGLTNLLKGMVKTSGKSLPAKTASYTVGMATNAATEGLTEGAQTVIEEYLSQNKEVGDMTSAMQATSMGSLIGAGMKPAAPILGAALKTPKVAATGAVGVAGAIASGVQSAKERTAPKTPERIQREKLHQADAAHGYEDTLKATVASGDVAPLIDPNKPEYNPHLAVSALAQMNESPDLPYEEKAANIEKAIEAHQSFKKEALIDEAMLEHLKEKKKAGTLTPAERKMYRDLEATAKGNDAYLTKISGLVSTMLAKTEQRTPQELKDNLVAAQASKDPEQVNTALKQIFGSASGGTDIDSLGSTLQALKQESNLDPETAQFIDDALAFAESAQKLKEHQNKTTGDVHNDVLRGDVKDGYRGVSSYNQAISSALAQGKDTVAQAELVKLSTWAASHQQKASILRKAHNAILTKEALSPEDQATLDRINEERATKGLTQKNKVPFQPRPGVQGWENLLSTMEYEADTLGKAVTVAKGLFKQYGKHTPTAPAATAPVKPATAPVMKPETKATSTTPETPKVEQEASQTTKDKIHVDFMAKDRSGHSLDQLNKTRESKQKTLADPDKKNLHPYAQTELDHIESLIAAYTPPPKEKAKVPTPAEKKQSTTPPVADPVVSSPEAVSTPPKQDSSTQKTKSESQTKPDIADAFNEASAQIEDTLENFGDIEIQSTEKIVAQENRPKLLNEELTVPDPLPENIKDYHLLVNYVRKFFTPKEGVTSPLHTVSNFFGSVKEYIKAQALKANEAKLLISMADFHAGFSPVVRETFRPMTQAFRYKDPLQYLANDQGVLPDGVVDVITTASYKWLATRGQETLFNDTRTIQKILGLQKEVNIDAARPFLKEIGLQQDALADTLGQEIYRLLEIRPKKTAPKDFEARLIKALGLHAIASMQHKGLLTMTPVFTGRSSTKHKSDGTYGIDALKNNIINALGADGHALSPADGSFFVPIQSKPDLTGRTMTNFYRIATAPNRDKQGFLQPVKELDGYSQIWNEAKQLYDTVFAMEPDQTEYSWTPAEGGQTVKLKRTTKYTTVEQADNVVRNNNEGYVLSRNTARPFFALDQQSQLEVAGYTDPTAEHVDDQLGVEDANNGLLRQLQAVHNWGRDALNQPNKLDSIFYIPVEFYRNMRMGQRGSINPQNSKIHRYLFGIPAWKSDITLSRNKRGTLTVTEARFFEALGLGLGIESGKKGGLKKALTATQEKLKDEKIVAAVQVLRDTEQAREQEGFKFTPEQAKTLVAGVKEGGENVKTFKALVEYSRYLNAKENSTAKKFTTDIATEIDGMSNGPILMKMQFLFEVTKSNLAMLRNGGLSFDESQPDVGVHLGNKAQMDAYEAGGMAWSESLETRMADLLQEMKATVKTDPARAREVKQELSRITATKRLLGEFNDEEGFVVKTVRKLIKYRIVATEYGSGATAVKAAFTGSVEEVVRGKLKKLSQMDTSTQEQKDQLYQELKSMADDVNILANLDPKKAKPADYFQIPAKVEDLFDAKGNLKKDLLLKLRIPAASLKNIHNHLEKNHGDALVKGMNELFGEMSAARKNFNLGFTIVTSLYNVARKIAVEARKKELDLPIVLNEKGVVTRADLSIEEYAKIDAKLAKLFPTVTTPFGGKLDLAKQSKDKMYSPGGGRIEQKYGPPRNKGKFPSQKTGYIADPAVLQMPGVSPIVMSIIMMDAYISNKTQGDGLAILNCHDGFYTGLNNVQEVNEALNKNMLELMRDFDLAQTMYESADASVRAFNTFRAEYDGYKDDDQKSIWDMQLNEAFAKNFITQNTYGKELFEGDYKVAIQETLAAMKHSAAVATKNKAELLSYLKNLNQYYYPNGGIVVDAAPVEQVQIPSEELAELDTTSEAAVKERAAKLVALQETNKQELKALFDEYLKNIANTQVPPTWRKQEKGALPVAESSRRPGMATTAIKSGPTDISVDALDYDPAIEISKQNVVDTYDQIKTMGTVQDTFGHDLHLRRILFNIIGKVMNPADLFLKTSSTEVSSGAFVTQDGVKNKIFLSAQTPGPAPVSGILAQGIRMSTGEVFTHELVHAIVHHGLKMNVRLRGQVDSLYQLAQKELNKNGTGFKAFLADPTMDITDPANALEVQAAKDRWEYIFGDKVTTVKVQRKDSATGLDRTKEYSQHLDEFMAFGLTNAAFMQALNTLSMESYQGKLFKASSWAGIKGKNIQETLVNLLERITDMFMHNFTSQRPAANVVKELESLAQRLAAVDSNYKSALAGMLDKVEGHARKINDYMNGQIKGVFSSLDRKLKISHKAGAIKYHYMKQNSAFGQILRDYRAKVDGFNYGVTQAAATSIKGLTDRVQDLHLLLNTRRIVIDQAREQATLATKSSLQNLWKRELEPKEKEAVLTTLIRADLNALREHFGMTGIQALVDTTPAARGQLTALDQAIKDLEQQLSEPHLQRHTAFFLKQAQSLGHIMATGQALEKVSFLNPTLIASARNTRIGGLLTKEQTAAVEPLIDRLASLYALNFTRGDHRQMVHALMTEDMDAVENVLLAHATLMEDAKVNLFNNNPLKIMKGYTKDITNPQIKITTAPLSEEAALQALGYVRSTQPLLRDERDPDGTPMYLYTSRLGSANDRNSGIASWTRNHARGTNPVQNALRQGKDPLMGMLDNAALIQQKIQDLNASLTTPFVRYTQGQSLPNYMIPQVDDKGKITKFRYTMNNSTKDGLLQRHNAYDDVLGAMAGAVPDKVNTDTINAELIQALKDVYDIEYKQRHTAYVEISPFASNAAHREFYHMMPEKAKAEMEKVWGGQSMWVAKDIVDLAFGSKKYSILEAFAKDPAMRNFVEKSVVSFAQNFFKDKTLTRVKQIEDVLQSMTKLAKNNIIVKSFIVSWDNHISNLLFTKARGVSYANIIRWKAEASSGVLKYQATKKALDDAELRLSMNQKRKPSATVSQATIDQTGKRLETRIRELKNELALNPVSELMDAGLMQSIVDDVEMGGVQSPYPNALDTWTEKLEKRLPSKMVNVGKVIFLAEDTQGYKILSNAVKMTDFIGRYIMYKHYMQNVPKKDFVTAHADAVARVIHEFVNFNLPDHRMIDYANNMGMVWFTKYTLRILKPVAQMIKERPFEALTTFALASTLGMPNVIASTLFLGKNPFDVLGNPLSAFISSSDDAITLQAAEAVVDALRK